MKSGKKLTLHDDEVLVVEGIHALNPELTAQIPKEQIFRVYASALTTILLDNHNYVPTTDNRLLRRIIRDYKYRGVSALDTIRRWPSVRAGENKWIFPSRRMPTRCSTPPCSSNWLSSRVRQSPCWSKCPRTVLNMPKPTAC